MVLSRRAWLLVDIILALVESVRSLPAFVSPITIPKYHWPQCRQARCSGTAQMTTASSSARKALRGASSEEHRGGVQELRQLTWMEAEARIKRDITEVGRTFPKQHSNRQIATPPSVFLVFD